MPLPDSSVKQPLTRLTPTGKAESSTPCTASSAAPTPPKPCVASATFITKNPSLFQSGYEVLEMTRRVYPSPLGLQGVGSTVTSLYFVMKWPRAPSPA